jgi:phytoene synthase
MAGEIRLQWWREAIAGTRAGEAAANPVAAAVRETIARYGLEQKVFDDLLEARAFDLYDDPMPNLEAFAGYCRRTASGLIELAARVLGERGAVLGEVAAPAGIAYATTGLLRAFALHASRGQLYPPADVLARHRVSTSDVFAGRSTEALRAALAEMRALAQTNFSDFAARRTALPPATIPAFLAVALVPAYLARMERRDYDPFTTSVELPQWRRQWLLWRAARVWN